MIKIIHDLPPHVLGIQAPAAVTKQDFNEVIKPALNSLFKRTGKINYLLLLDTTVSNFTIGAWGDDLILGMRHFAHWNRIAIVTNQKMVEKFSDAFCFVLPGKSKELTFAESSNAKIWVIAGEK